MQQLPLTVRRSLELLGLYFLGMIIVLEMRKKIKKLIAL